MKEVFCPECRRDVKPKVEKRREAFPVRGEDVEVETKVAVCLECGNDVFVEELDSPNLAAAFDEYRRLHELLAPGEIAEIRKKYGLGQRAFSLLLGWGEITLHRYESGALQDSTHDGQLRLARDPHNVQVLFEANGDKLSEGRRERLRARLGQLIRSEEDRSARQCLKRYFARDEVDEFGGYKALDASKLRKMVLYFAARPRMFVTKVNKLLFYSDFLYFKENAVSISGCVYLRYEHGPVPQHYELLQAELAEDGLLDRREEHGPDYDGEILVARKRPDMREFSKSELRVLRFVATTLGTMRSRDLSEMSHDEVAYKSTKAKELISYRHAEKLSLSLG